MPFAADGNRTCFTCKKPGHISKDCKYGRPTCFRCEEQGHLSSSCPKRSAVRGSSLNLVNQDGEEAALVADVAKESASTSEVYTVNRGDSCVSMRCAGNVQTVLFALIDTGSPVSLIKKTTYQRLYKDTTLREKVIVMVTMYGINYVNYDFYN